MRRQPSRWRRPEGKQAAATQLAPPLASPSPPLPRAAADPGAAAAAEGEQAATTGGEAGGGGRRDTGSGRRLRGRRRWQPEGTQVVEGGAPAGPSLHPPLHPLSARCIGGAGRHTAAVGDARRLMAFDYVK
ncbi:hypothetical protein E2562_027762 [Oryza meyeriana var. granulata]|uniref:Uncharacterized protein n=1 Tax=Oryza meyeriana var. granulata TaxID=110450 RepID=A0A6G1EDX2_9ORYZ|nr:hypothetical protein E2562_027762 [Oryza meyeriana var. granulata]